MLLCATSEDRCDGGHAKFRRLLDSPFHVIELVDSHQEMNGECGPGFHLFMQGENDLVFADSGDLGTVEKSSGDDIKKLSRLGSKDASEVLGLVANKRCRGAFVVPCICDPSATS